MDKSRVSLKILVVIAYTFMMVFNFLANALPFNGKSTGEISDKFDNLFTPAGMTFSIWGLIYILLFLFVIYQLEIIKKTEDDTKDKRLDKIRIIFIINALANSFWLIAWHYILIPASLIIMLTLLVTLIMINRIINSYRLENNLSVLKSLFLRIPFGVYFGWITIATIANVTIFLLDLGFDGWIIPDPIWMVIVLSVGVLITSLVTFKEKNIGYGATIIFSYSGILIKHLSKEGFDGKYILVIVFTIVSIFVITSVNALAIFNLKLKKTDEKPKEV